MSTLVFLTVFEWTFFCFLFLLPAAVSQRAPSQCPLAAAGVPWPPAEVPWPPAEAPSARSASRTSTASRSMTSRTALQTTGSICASTSFPLSLWRRTCRTLIPSDTRISISNGGLWIPRSPWHPCPHGPPCHRCPLRARLWTPHFSPLLEILRWLRCQKVSRRWQA